MLPLKSRDNTLPVQRKPFPRAYPISALKQIPIVTSYPKVLIMCGLPNCGKSELAQIISANTGAKILSSGEYRKKMFAKPTYSQKESAAVFEYIRKEAENFILKGIPVIFDATNLETKNRKTFTKLAKRCHAEIGCIYVEMPLEESLKENENKTSSKIKKDILLRMGKHIHIPSYCEGLNRIYCADRNADSSDFRLFWVDRSVMMRIQNLEKRKYAKKFVQQNSNRIQTINRHTA